jgi:hypothetical protein
MLRLRFLTDSQPRWKNGQPPHSTAGVASASCSHAMAGGGSIASESPPIAIASNGTESAAATQKRRVMSRSSGFAASPAVGIIGSSAMPQIGQEPGISRTICGCIGQVHSVPAAANAPIGLRPA